MEAMWGTALWRQFGAAIDVLEQALAACPDALWTERVWPGPPSKHFPPQFGEFWYLTFHTLVWLDLYLSGLPEEEFAPPDPFPAGEVDSMVTLQDRPYTRAELHTYLAFTRQKCQAILAAMTEEQALRPVEYPWMKGEPVTYLELQIYNMRHVQEHAAQLSLFLGQHTIPDSDLRWIARAKGDAANREAATE